MSDEKVNNDHNKLLPTTYNLRTKSGFTLIELLLYVSIAATMLLAISILFSVLLSGRVKNQTIAEVNEQGVLAMQIMTQAVRNADSINLPSAGASASTLSLVMPTPAQNPTVFDLTSNVIRTTEGAGSAVPLTNSTRVTVSSLTFQNLSLSGTPGTIRIQFTLTHINPSGRNEYNYNKTFYGSASLR